MHKFLLWERLPAANRAADGTPTGWCQHFTRGEFQKQYEITISPCAPGHPLLLRNSPCNSYYETSFPDNVKEALGRVFNVLAAAYDSIFQSINESEERVRGLSVSRFSESVHVWF
jgi:hypothetical protein